jgi:transposase-like protein
MRDYDWQISRQAFAFPKKEKVREIMKCRNCGSENSIKYGKRDGIQCYRCKNCGFQFTKETERHTENEALLAVSLYSLGFSYRAVEKLMYVSRQTVFRWVRDYSLSRGRAPDTGEIAVGREEMRRFILDKQAEGHCSRALLDRLNGFAPLFS